MASIPEDGDTNDDLDIDVQALDEELDRTALEPEAWEHLPDGEVVVQTDRDACEEGNDVPDRRSFLLRWINKVGWLACVVSSLS
jgi:hypothetical protein